ncbi:hypothetical protein FSDG_01491 [Fusobacterium animalis 7_1]|jgi:hypothetical protein|uniref:Uncharacterized protein n=1 Tax=Fusobacterium animalis 7_1 TaxID=457405 RepID=A0A140PT42_9FUSO|nr:MULTISPECIES: hypothetical protein [Fusobacterium]EEO42932.1 hypothetical protein FSDG_01491 [Fusobacterium animalis 7_1]EPC08360.1 hypothetical protein HMPREF9369_03163 [Fusobacterium polymorphum F0401]
MELNFVEIFIHRDGSISRIFADKYILDIKNSKFMYKEELDRIYTDDSNQDILNRNIVNFQTLINKREYAPTFKEDSTKNIQIFFNNTVNIGFNIKEKIEKLNIKELKVIDLKELYHINFAELVSKIYKKDIQNLDFMNSLTKIYFKFFLKKLLERDTLILKALTM